MHRAWEDVKALIYIDSKDKFPLQPVLRNMLLIIYPFLQKFFMKGIMMGSLKG